MPEVNTKVDFIQWLGPDISKKVLTCLDDPCDLVRVSAVSSSWYRFVIENGLCKQLYLKLFPELSRITVEVDNMIEPISNVLGSSINWECLKRNHKVYGLLAFGLTPTRNNYISKTNFASWANFYPRVSIPNTLGPRDEIENWAPFLPSIAEGHPHVLFLDALIYKLCSKICLVTEIHVRQSPASFDEESPIYLNKAVRIRMGHSRYPKLFDIPTGMGLNPVVVENGFKWTYTSPIFSLSQENQWHEYKLAEPVLCIGGVLLLEEYGRFGIPNMNSSFRGSFSDVQLVGRSLSPSIDVKMQYPSGKCTLKYFMPAVTYLNE